MKKLFSIGIALFMTFAAGAQTTIDISAVNSAYTTTVDGSLVIDVAKTASKIASPLVSFTNPFKGKSFTTAEISFDVYNYSDVHVLGALLSIYDPTLGRMYFSNGSYWGYNATGGWFDANLVNYGVGTNFIGSNTWKNVKLQFSSTGYAMYVDNVLAFNQSSTGVTINGNLTDYTKPISFLQNAASFVIGTGSWWSDNTKTDGTYWDAQSSYIKNIKFTTDFTTSVAQASTEVASVVANEFFSIGGARLGSDYNALPAGVYIKKSIFNNGSVQCAQIAKNR